MDQATKYDLVSAKAKHLLFKSKMRAYLAGSQDVAEDVLADPNACALGKWIIDVGAKYNHHPQMTQLNDAHQKIHVKAREIIVLKKANRHTDAELKMNDIEQIGSTIVSIIEELESKLSN